MSGCLYVVGTPLGNLGDLTPRARETLASVDLVACEDTRRTRALLSHLGIRVETLAIPAHREAERAEAVARRLAAGADVALVTDAGMPGISDPGTQVVRAALGVGATVVPVPGPSALSTAVAASGLAAHPLHFIGFLPRKGGERRRRIEEAGRWPGAVVLFESPHRVGDTLTELADAWGADRPAVVARELTKRFESFARGTLGTLAERFAGAPLRGEVTIVVGARPQAPAERGAPDLEAALEAVAAQVAAGVRAKDACKAVGRVQGIPATALYRAWNSRRG